MAVDKGFAKRLNEACDGHPHIPEYGHGRQTWVKEKMDVSHEAVRKWFMGQARPRPDKMAQLAALFEVDQAWLALGMKPDMDRHATRMRPRELEGAVHCVAGVIQLNGGNIAFPDENDPRRNYVDIYAIIRGAQYHLHVALAKEQGPHNYRLTIPKEYTECTVIGVINFEPLRCAFLSLTHELIDRHGIRRGGFYELNINGSTDNTYMSGKDTWPQIRNFSSRI